MPIFNYDHFVSIKAIDMSRAVDHIPPMVYRFAMEGMELVLRKDRKRFDTRTPTFGHHEYNVTEVTKTFNDTEGTLGVLLVGEKGTGKSMMGEDLANRLLVQDMPVLMIDKNIPGEIIRDYARVIAPCLIYFDEFGKVYSEEEERQQLLTLFSDTSLKRVMFVVSANHYGELSEFMIDRPGRFKFRFMYNRLDMTIVEQMCDHFKVTGEIREAMLDYAWSSMVTYDILNMVLKEAIKYDNRTDLFERMRILNVPPVQYRTYDLSALTVKGEAVQLDDIRFTQEGSRLELEILEKGKIAHHFEFEFDTVEKILMRGKPTQRSGCVYTVNLSADVTARLKANLRIMPNDSRIDQFNFNDKDDDASGSRKTNTFDPDSFRPAHRSLNAPHLSHLFDQSGEPRRSKNYNGK